ncbi:uncharacterized protein DS421_8g226510 [Arachis hypogaea]|nr:uncharacterized protein DS421_8g226510 [Arachis hypogaea]
MVFNTLKILWRVVGMNRTLQTERGFQGQHGYLGALSTYIESARDVAVLEAMLESGARKGELVHVKRF